MSSTCPSSQVSTNAESAHAIAFVLIDGLGDVSVPFLKGKTPLQFASTKHLDSIAGALPTLGSLQKHTHFPNVL